MADSIDALITENLRAAVHAKSFTYNGSSRTSTAELQRTIREAHGRYPYIEVCGPWVDVAAESAVSMTTELHYAVEWRILHDDRGQAKDPIATVARNVAADIIKLIRTDDTRGGYALITNVDGWGHRFELDGTGRPEFVVYVDMHVKTMINRNDPYSLG